MRTLPKALLILLFAVVLTNRGKAANDSIPAKKVQVFYKLYPGGVFMGQLPQYCSDLKFGTEVLIKEHHGIELQAGACLINPFTALVMLAIHSSERSSEAYWFFGGRGSFSYRYYFGPKKGKHKPGGFIGIYLSVMGLKSLYRMERHEDPYYYSEYTNWFTRSYTHILMSNYALQLGYQVVTGKAIIEISGHFGYRYDYFWRTYKFPVQGVAEYDVTADRLYRYYKKVPVGGGINLSIGGLF